jgi:hypothetical protein
MKNKVSLSLLCLFALALRARGWWDTGHMLVSQIAWKHLASDPTATPALLNALDNAVNSLVSYSPASNTFVTAACWMDDLKSRNLNQFNNWHFINLPICDFPNSTDTDSCDNTSVLDVLDSDQEDVIWAINMAISTIKGNYALGFERGFAFRNLLHLVGDLHQPLHAVARYSPQTPNGDAGGNLFPIVNVSYAKNLHSLWDSGVGYLSTTLPRPLNSSNAQFISNMADEMIARTANLTQNMTKINATEWALESRELAMLYVYNLTFNSTPSEYYLAQAWDVIQDQIGVAGYRLHLILKQMVNCTSNNSNCPASEQPAQSNDSVWFIVGVVLAVALGISLIVNIILIVRGTACRSNYAPVQ